MVHFIFIFLISFNLSDVKMKIRHLIRWYHIISIIGWILLALFMIDMGLQDNESCCTPEDVFIPNGITIFFVMIWLIFEMIWLGATIESGVKRVKNIEKR